MGRHNKILILILLSMIVLCSCVNKVDLKYFEYLNNPEVLLNEKENKLMVFAYVKSNHEKIACEHTKIRIWNKENILYESETDIYGLTEFLAADSFYTEASILRIEGIIYDSLTSVPRYYGNIFFKSSSNKHCIKKEIELFPIN